MKKVLLLATAGCIIALGTVIVYRALRNEPHELVDVGGDISASADGPLTIRVGDPRILICVESDRQHVTAFDSTGKLLWHRDLRQLVQFPERGKQPIRALFLGKPDDWMIKAAHSRNVAAIGLSTKEFGLLDARTGEYRFVGND